MSFLKLSNMKFTLLLPLLLCLVTATPLKAQAPEIDHTPYKIVFQLTSADTAVHHALIKQIYNILTAAPKSKIEVVCHSNGVYFLVTAKTFQSEKIRELNSQGIQFVACENSMRSHKIKREELVKEAGTVPSGLVEIVKKQNKRWAYLKAG